MATRTISNAGGNYNATGTWVEGIVPTSADDVVATATSGQLTVNVASAASSFNFTNYTNTLTLNAVWTVSGGVLQTFVAAMGISGSSSIFITSSNAQITSNGKIIPNLSFNSNKTLNDVLNVVNFSFNNSLNIINNSLNVSGSLTSGINSTIGGPGNTFINLTGTGPITLPNYRGSGLVINSPTTISGSTTGIGLGGGGVLTYSAGTLNQMRIKALNFPITINGGSGASEFETFDITDGIVAGVLNLTGEFKVKNFIGAPNSTTYNPSVSTNNYLTIAGTGALNVTQSMNLLPGIINNTGIIQHKPFNIGFNTGVTHTISTVNINGFLSITPNTTSSAASARFRSATPGTRANINLLNPLQSVISNTNVTDINFTGPAVFTLGTGSTITNSLNVTNGVIGGSGTTAGGAWTFLN
jgi:hypothetical protein